MGNALQEQDKLEEAIEAYKKVISVNPDYAEAYNNMGNALQDQGKFNDAIKAYKKASQLIRIMLKLTTTWGMRSKIRQT